MHALNMWHLTSIMKLKGSLLNILMTIQFFILKSLFFNIVSDISLMVFTICFIIYLCINIFWVHSRISSVVVVYDAALGDRLDKLRQTQPWTTRPKPTSCHEFCTSATAHAPSQSNSLPSFHAWLRVPVDEGGGEIKKLLFAIKPEHPFLILSAPSFALWVEAGGGGLLDYAVHTSIRSL
jgi:hypothetical protein